MNMRNENAKNVAQALLPVRQTHCQKLRSLFWGKPDKTSGPKTGPELQPSSSASMGESAFFSANSVLQTR
jgi:hypothetical protein